MAATVVTAVMVANKSLSNQRGSALVIALIISVVVAIFALTLPRFFSELNSEYKVHNAKATALMIKENLISILDNDSAWYQTVMNNNNLACLRSPGGGAPCSTFGNIEVYEGDGVKFLSNAPSSGFDIQGNPCDNFDPVNGHESCVFKYNVTWSCYGACGTTSFTGAQFVASTPQIQLHATLQYSPKGSTLKNALRVADSSANGSSPYTINFVRGHENNTLSNYCNSINGVFDQSSGQCQATTGEPVNFTCPDRYWFVGFNPDGSPNCAPDIKLNAGCPNGKAALGYDANGGLLCGAF